MQRNVQADSDDGDDNDVISEDDNVAQVKPLSKAFAGKDDSSDEEGKEQDYMAKLDKKERKKFKKDKQRDKIGTRDARVLTGARTVADHAILSAYKNKVSDSSKRIKKGRGTFPNEITREKVHEKLKTRRLAIPQTRMLLK